MSEPYGDILDALKKELSFLQGGGYRLPPHGWKLPLIFEDSPICVKRELTACHATRCALMKLVPPEFKSARVPCRYIPLNALGETVDSLYRTATNEEIEDALYRWLLETIARLAAQGNEPASIINKIVRKEPSMSLTKLKQFLDGKQVKYIVISHSLAYTAQGVAALAHIPGRELAKTVIVKMDGALAMAVVPASRHVDLAMLKSAAGAKSVELALEKDFKDRFPDCETGAMPPFGHLYGMAVFVDEILAQDKEIAFNAGTHRELVRLAWEDFERLAMPKIAKFTTGRSAQQAA
jgi:Ala-tRNA(Pro) deacylase